MRWEVVMIIRAFITNECLNNDFFYIITSIETALLFACVISSVYMNIFMQHRPQNAETFPCAVARFSARASTNSESGASML